MMPTYLSFDYSIRHGIYDTTNTNTNTGGDIG